MGRSSWVKGSEKGRPSAEQKNGEEEQGLESTALGEQPLGSTSARAWGGCVALARERGQRKSSHSPLLRELS